MVVFDCDGVMFDTADANRAYYDQILAHFGKPPMTPEQFAYAHMHTVEESIANLFENDAAAIAAAHAYRQEVTYTGFIPYMKMEPHLKPLLEKLRAAGYHTAIATNRTDSMAWVLREFDLEAYFDLVVTALDVEHPKPSPDQLFRVLEHFGVSPGQVLYVGDSLVDSLAAKAAGVPMAAYGDPDLASDFHISSLKEIESVLGNV